MVDVLENGVCSQRDVLAEAGENMAVPKQCTIYSKSHNIRDTIFQSLTRI